MVGKAASFDAETVTLLRDFANQKSKSFPVRRLAGGVCTEHLNPHVTVMKSEPRLEHAGDQHSKRVQDGNHRLNDATILLHDANLRRMEFSERTG
jgi:hypothetical protein